MQNGEYDRSSPAWEKLTAEAKDFIVKLLHTDPFQRLTAKEALEHPWLAKTALHLATNSIANEEELKQSEIRVF